MSGYEMYHNGDGGNVYLTCGGAAVASTIEVGRGRWAVVDHVGGGESLVGSRQEGCAALRAAVPAGAEFAETGAVS